MVCEFRSSEASCRLLYSVYFTLLCPSFADTHIISHSAESNRLNWTGSFVTVSPLCGIKQAQKSIGETLLPPEALLSSAI